MHTADSSLRSLSNAAQHSHTVDRLVLHCLPGKDTREMLPRLRAVMELSWLWKGVVQTPKQICTREFPKECPDLLLCWGKLDQSHPNAILYCRVVAVGSLVKGKADTPVLSALSVL